MNTKSCLLTGLLLATTHYVANDNAYANYDIFRSLREHHQTDTYVPLVSPECGSPTQLALDSTLDRAFPAQSQASVLGLSGLWNYAFASTHTSELLDTMSATDMPLVEVDARDHLPESTPSVKTHKLVAIAGSQEETLDYQAYSTQEEPRLDIWVSDTVLNSINTYGAKKLGIKIAPSDNMFHIYNKADFQFMTLLLSLGGDDGWNFIHIPNCKQKKQTFDTNAWLSCTGGLRTIACDYLDAYQDNADNATLFAQSQQRMPGATLLLLDSYRRFHADMRTKPDDVVRYGICQTIKRETKNLWLAKMGKRIGF